MARGSTTDAAGRSASIASANSRPPGTSMRAGTARASNSHGTSTASPRSASASATADDSSDGGTRSVTQPSRRLPMKKTDSAITVTSHRSVIAGPAGARGRSQT
jgi:hypothetical protein